MFHIFLPFLFHLDFFLPLSHVLSHINDNCLFQSVIFDGIGTGTFCFWVWFDLCMEDSIRWLLYLQLKPQ